MFKKGDRVKCFRLGAHFKKLGTVVSGTGQQSKVLFDDDRVEGPIDNKENRTAARYFLNLELAADDGLEFNDDLYAHATPAFWDAWNANGKRLGMYALLKVPASAIGLTGDRDVWLVFVNADVRRGFRDKLYREGKI